MKYTTAIFASIISAATAAPIRMRTAERALKNERETFELLAATNDYVEEPASMSMSVSMSYASDDVPNSVGGISFGVAAGAAVIGAVALF